MLKVFGMLSVISIAFLSSQVNAESKIEKFATPEGVFNYYLSRAEHFTAFEDVLPFYSEQKGSASIAALNMMLSRHKQATREYFTTQYLSKIRAKAVCERLTLSSVKSAVKDGSPMKEKAREIDDKGEYKATLIYLVDDVCTQRERDFARVEMVLEKGAWKINSL